MRVVTWNIQTARPNPDGPADVALAVDCLRSLDADVYALQELDRARERTAGVDQPSALAAGLGGTLAFSPTVTDEGHYGIGVVSRVGVRRSYETGLSGTREPRVLLVTEVTAADGVTWTIAGTHLSRRRSFATSQLERALAVLLEHPEPRVLMGDLNLPRRMVSPLAGAAGFTVVPGPATHSTRRRRPTDRIDHILVSGASVDGSDVHRFPVSDHCAVSATLTATP